MQHEWHNDFFFCLVAEAEQQVCLAHVLRRVDACSGSLNAHESLVVFLHLSHVLLRAHYELLAVALGYAVGAVETVDVCRAVAVKQLVVVDLRCTRRHLVGADGSRLLAAGGEGQTAQGCY